MRSGASYGVSLGFRILRSGCLSTCSCFKLDSRLPCEFCCGIFGAFPLIMGSRRTNNSVDAALSSVEQVSSALSIGADTVSSASPPPQSQPNSSLASIAGISVPPSPQLAGSGSPISPEMVALVAQTVQQAVQAALSAKNSAPHSQAMPASSTSVAPTHDALTGLSSSFLASGTGFHPGQASSSAIQGRNVPFVVPSFVSTFAAPVPALASSSPRAISGSSPGVPHEVAPHASLLSEQPFVVGPGFSPVPSKLVTQIQSGKYVDLSELLAANLVHLESEPQLLLDGRLILTTPPKKQRRRIEDITSWTEAFSIFSLVLMAYFPQRWRDLTMYKLLILRIHRQFNGRVWFSYDEAFRQHAAATRLVDWSAMNAQLFNFHAAGASVRSASTGSTDSPEPSGSRSSRIPCFSWNKGHCTAPNATCRYYHRCSSCSGLHRALSCSSRSERKFQSTGKHRSSSPVSPAHKSRRQ